MQKRRIHRAKPFGGYIIVTKEKNKWVLKSMTLGLINPIGPRLHRFLDWPLEKDRFDTKQQAQEAADKANQYLNASPPASWRN